MAIELYATFFDEAGFIEKSFITLADFRENYFYREIKNSFFLSSKKIYKIFELKNSLPTKNISVSIDGGSFPQNKAEAGIDDEFFYTIYQKQKDSIFSPSRNTVQSYFGANEFSKYVDWLDTNIYKSGTTKTSVFNQIFTGVSQVLSSTKLNELDGFDYKRKIFITEEVEQNSSFIFSFFIASNIDFYSKLYSDVVYVRIGFEENTGTTVSPVWVKSEKLVPLKIFLNYESLLALTKSKVFNLYSNYSPFMGNLSDIDMFLEKNYG